MFAYALMSACRVSFEEDSRADDWQQPHQRGVDDLQQRYTFGEQWFGVARWMAALGGAERGQLLTHIGGEM